MDNTLQVNTHFTIHTGMKTVNRLSLESRNWRFSLSRRMVWTQAKHESSADGAARRVWARWPIIFNHRCKQVCVSRLVRWCAATGSTAPRCQKVSHPCMPKHASPCLF